MEQIEQRCFLTNYISGIKVVLRLFILVLCYVILLGFGNCEKNNKNKSEGKAHQSLLKIINNINATYSDLESALESINTKKKKT